MTAWMIYTIFACFLAGAGVIVTLFARMLFGKRDLLSVCSVALGEVGVKSRIKKAMSYKRPMLWVIIACILLCVLVAVLFLTDPKGEDDTSSEFSDESVLEVSDESSAEDSFESSEPEESSVPEESSEPEESGDSFEPTYPEERETTAEKVFSYDIGLDGLFQYDFLYESDPSGAQILTPDHCFLGTDGKFYVTGCENAYHGLHCVGDGRNWQYDFGFEMIAFMRIVGDHLYISTYQGSAYFVYTFDISDGLAQAELIKKATQRKYGSFFVFDGKVYYGGAGDFYHPDGKPVEDGELPFVYQTGCAYPVQIAADGSGRWLVDSERAAVIGTTDACIFVSEKDTVDTERTSVVVYTCYDKQGNPVWRFAYSREYSRKSKPCEIDFDMNGRILTVTRYSPGDVFVGDVMFEDVVSAQPIFGPQGEVFIALYYPNHCDIYRVDAGYTSAEFEEPTPEPVIPEERETTAEKVLSFDIGVDGLHQYSFVYYDNPTSAIIETPYRVFMGTDGKFYEAWSKVALNGVICVSDGSQWYENIHSGSMDDAWIVGNTLYVTTYDNSETTLHTLDISRGLENADLQSSVPLDDARIFVYDGKLYLYREGTFYRPDGTEANGEIPFAYSREINDYAVQASINGDGWSVDTKMAVVCSVTEDLIWISESDAQAPDGTDISVYTCYDRDGNIVSRFAYKTVYSRQKFPCELYFEQNGGKHTVREYSPNDVIVGGVHFENVLGSKLFFGYDGTPYVALYYLDHCDIYRVEAGYTGERFTNRVSAAEPVYPDESETTLTHLRDYTVGEGGIPMGSSETAFPSLFAADENGTLYAYHDERLYDLDNGKTLQIPHSGNTFLSFEVYGGKLFGLMHKGGADDPGDISLHTYTMNDGKTETREYNMSYMSRYPYMLFLSEAGEPMIGGQFSATDMDGRSAGSRYCFLGNFESDIRVENRTYDLEFTGYAVSDIGGVLTVYCTLDDETASKDIVYRFDRDGKMIARFVIEYTDTTVTVGGHTFENVLAHEWFVGGDGVIYLLTMNQSGASLYQIDAGYTEE